MSSVARKVSLAEPAAKPSSSSSSSASPSKEPSVKLDPKKVEKELYDSIPEKEKTTTSSWLVKQVVITRLDSSSSSSSSAPAGVNVAPSAGGVPPMLGKLKKQGTSKMHKFQPSVKLTQSLTWLSEYGYADSTILFDNGCAFLFEHGKFVEFEDIRDDDDD